ncbi:collagen alpha-3(VI) chain-like [Mercenaria mercenaria]|uniref:collagen alpha-3(VI) chain-like n=1 Tax=Mercenaria mercenaria TaxID=6596 RepID=UPI00234F101E|nr:collagen alpha-3(VI) chain-like [Mercenaria mercenaria]
MYIKFTYLEMRPIVTYFVLCITVAVTLAQTVPPACDDIDTSACQLMVAQKPDLCSDPSLAKPVCPRYCKLCPVECYHCNATVLDYHLCNTTMLCAEGEVCMRKELKSFVDGHHEYQMTCEARQICDGGSDLSIPFGKRDIEQRDISITCCADDLCNYPGGQVPSPTSSGCPKDIYFLVDGASHVVKTEHLAVLNTLMAVAKSLDIGMTDNLIALYTYDQSLHEKIELQQNTDVASLVASLQYQNLHGQNRNSDTEEAIQNLVQHVMTPRAGDRSGYPDAVVLVTDTITAQRVHLGIRDKVQLKGASHDVILLSVGLDYSSLFGISGDGGNTIATDKTHILHVSNLNALMNVVDSLVALLNKC